MIPLKSKEEIDIMRTGGRILARALEKAAVAVRQGTTLKELDTIARESIIAAGAKPAFFGYGQKNGQSGYPATLCASVNDEVVHGIGCRVRILQNGDIVGLDLGVKYRGMYTDMAVSVGVGIIDSESERLLRVTWEALEKAIALVAPGVHTSELSRAIQKHCEGNGFSVIRDMSGHGIGHSIHEEPSIFCFDNPRNPDVVLKEDMVICIEPMVTAGDWRTVTDDDCWTIRTADCSRSAHFEHTIAVTHDGHEILTSNGR